MTEGLKAVANIKGQQHLTSEDSSHSVRVCFLFDIFEELLYSSYSNYEWKLWYFYFYLQDSSLKYKQGAVR